MSATEPTDRDVLVFDGVVTDAQRGDIFRVDCAAGALRREVLAKRGGRLVQAKIKIVSGDRVRIEVSPYDMTRGRITRRLS
jgi:translation initiation factor IF-1